MARLAVFASGNGSNFVAIAEHIASTSHTLCCLICNRKSALVNAKAKTLSIPVVNISYAGRPRERTEADIQKALDSYRADVIALAGYMKIFTSAFVQKYEGRMINIHPSLLPKYPGIHGIEEGFHAGDTELGVTVHLVDSGVDTGPILCQKSFTRSGDESLEEVKAAIHAIEHQIYPDIIIEKLDIIDKQTSEVEK